MRSAGWERVITALCSAPKMRARALIYALPSLLKSNAEEQIYRIYVSDALKIIGENTAKFSEGNYLKNRYLDLITPQKQEKRTEAEIIAQVKRAWGGNKN